MSRNAIVVTNINFDSIAKYTKPFFELYSKRTGADLIYITESNIHVTGEEYENLRFENLQVQKYFDLYDRIFLVDCDVILKLNCPDYFLLDPNSVYVTRLDKYSRYITWTRDTIKLIKQCIGDVNWKDNCYFNSGVMMLSKEHKELFNVNVDTLNKIQGTTRVQNYINWKIQKLNYDVVDLGPGFNFRGRTTYFGNMYKEDAHVLHYLGDKDPNGINFKTLVQDSRKYLKQSTIKSII